MAGLFLHRIQCEAQANPTSRELQLYTKGLENFRQHHSLINTVRHARVSTNSCLELYFKAQILVYRTLHVSSCGRADEIK